MPLTANDGDAIYRQGRECPLPSSVKDGNVPFRQASMVEMTFTVKRVDVFLPSSIKGGNGRLP
jgi:hypothetical protein